MAGAAEQHRLLLERRSSLPGFEHGFGHVADLVGLIAPTGRMLMIECKTETGTQSDEQKIMQRVVTQMGGLYVLARSVEDVDAALAQIGITR